MIYLLFAGDYYYPGCGMNDYKGSFDRVEDAVAYFNEIGMWDWYQVVEVPNDTVMVVVQSGGRK